MVTSPQQLENECQCQLGQDLKLKLFDSIVGNSSASIAWGVIVALAVGIIIVISLYFRRRVRNLKTEIAHVQYIADPPSQPDRHHFDNPVYAFQPSTSSQTASDSSTLLNNLRSNNKTTNLGRGKPFELKIFRLQNRIQNIDIDL